MVFKGIVEPAKRGNLSQHQKSKFTLISYVDEGFLPYRKLCCKMYEFGGECEAFYYVEGENGARVYERRLGK